MQKSHTSATRSNRASQGLEKQIPDIPKGQTPVHLRDKQIMADRRNVLLRGEKDVGIMKSDVSKASA